MQTNCFHYIVGMVVDFVGNFFPDLTSRSQLLSPMTWWVLCTYADNMFVVAYCVVGLLLSFNLSMQMQQSSYVLGTIRQKLAL